MHRTLIAYKASKKAVCLVALTALSSVCHALPFSIVPTAGTTLPTTISAGATATAYYSVTNITQSTRTNNHVKYLPPHVTQSTVDDTQTNICSASFTLAPGAHCNLKLIIAGAVDAKDPNPHHHLFVCFPGDQTCAGTNFPLNVGASGSQQNFKVTASGDDRLTFTATTPQIISSGSTASFNVSLSTGYLQAGSVGGTCPVGSWQDTTYTTGAITKDCTVIFRAMTAWADVTGDLSTNQLAKVRCHTTSDGSICVAFNGLINPGPLYQKINANDWVQVTNLANNIRVASCNSTICAAFNSVSHIFQAVNNQGSLTWEDVSPTSDVTFYAISCNDFNGGSSCLATGYTSASTAAIYQSINGKPWVNVSPMVNGSAIAVGFEEVGCTDDGTTCVAVGILPSSGQAVIYQSVDAGSHWADVTPLEFTGTSSASYFPKISCTGNKDRSICDIKITMYNTTTEAISNYIFQSIDAQAWTNATLPADLTTYVNAAVDISCGSNPKHSTCTTASEAGLLYRSQDGGTWSQVADIPSTTKINDTSCYGYNCIAVGATLAPPSLTNTIGLIYQSINGGPWTNVLSASLGATIFPAVISCNADTNGSICEVLGSNYSSFNDEIIESKT